MTKEVLPCMRDAIALPISASVRVSTPELELGFRLFDRKNRGFVLTPDGEYFYRKSLILTTCTAYVEVSAFSPLAARKEITPETLKNVPCILISSVSQRETEQEYDCRRHADLVVHDGARRSDFSA